MIKRYGLGAKPERQGEESVRFGLVGIIQRDDGDYVRYTDHKRLLDAAHGALELQEGKTIDEHMDEFEAFQEYGLERCNEGFYISINTLNNWYVWKAAKGIKE